jgi:serine O-acetyltransferase
MPEKFDFHGRLPELVDGLVESYRTERRTQHLDRSHLPSRAEAVRLLRAMFPLVYPGYFGPRCLTFDSVRYAVGEQLSKVGPRLAAQVRECLCHEAAQPGAPAGAAARCTRAADEITAEFFRRLTSVRAMLADDVQAAYDGDPAARNLDEPVLCYPGMLAVTIYRLAHELHLLGVPLLPRIMTEYAHGQTGIDIHPGAAIGRHFFIDHGTGVVIGETTVIGDRCKLYQGVTLGALSFPKDERGRVIRGTKRHPTLQDDVTIYSNATVLGGDTVIGTGAIIGGNVFVTRSVPPHSLVKAGHENGLTIRPLRTGAPAEENWQI